MHRNEGKRAAIIPREMRKSLSRDLMIPKT